MMFPFYTFEISGSYNSYTYLCGNCIFKKQSYVEPMHEWAVLQRTKTSLKGKKNTKCNLKALSLSSWVNNYALKKPTLESGAPAKILDEEGRKRLHSSEACH